MKLIPVAAAALLAFLSPVATAQQEESAETAAPSSARAHGGERFAIDHIFFFSDRFAPELAYAQQHGFDRWPFPNTHTGQGTTGAYMYFDNVYIEFLWVDDPEAAEANIPRIHSDFNLRNDWRKNPDISPFGIGLKDYEEDKPSPFETKEYTAEWMRGNFSLYSTKGAENEKEPYTFFLPLEITGEARATFGPQSAQHLEHPNGARVLTGVKLVLPKGQKLSQTLKTLEKEGVLEIGHGDAHLMELTFDDGKQGKTADLRPHSPFIIRY